MLLSFRVRAQTHDVKIRRAAETFRRLRVFSVCGIFWCCSAPPIYPPHVFIAALLTIALMPVLILRVDMIATNREHLGTLATGLRAFG